MIARSLTIRGLATFGSLLIAAVFVIGPFLDVCFAQMPMGQPQLSEMTDMLIGDWRTPLTRIVFRPGGEFTSYGRNKVYRGTFRLLDNRHVQMTFESGAVRVHFIRVLSATQWRHNLVGTESVIDRVRFETQEALSRWGDRQYVDGQASGKVPTASTSQGGTPKANSSAADYEAVIRGAVLDSIRRGTPSDRPSSTLSPREQEEFRRCLALRSEGVNYTHPEWEWYRTNCRR